MASKQLFHFELQLWGGGDTEAQAATKSGRFRQEIDEMRELSVKLLAQILRFRGWLLLVGRGGLTADFFGGAHGIERAGDYLRRARPIHFVGGLRLEELGVREDDAELVVEPVKEEPQL